VNCATTVLAVRTRVKVGARRYWLPVPVGAEDHTFVLFERSGRARNQRDWITFYRDADPVRESTSHLPHKPRHPHWMIAGSSIATLFEPGVRLEQFMEGQEVIVGQRWTRRRVLGVAPFVRGPGEHADPRSRPPELSRDSHLNTSSEVIRADRAPEADLACTVGTQLGVGDELDLARIE
jgi:hypothetical protein